MNYYSTFGRKPSKYGNKKTVLNGVTYDSKKEAQKAVELENMEKLGAISGLQRQVRFEICPKVPNLKGSRARYYVADFVFVDRYTGQKVIMDVKSPITKKNPVYTLKKQLVQVQYPEYDFREC